MPRILARRIPSPLAGAESCGPNQQWDPNYVMPGLPPGQCTPKGSPMTPAPNAPSWFDTAMSTLFPKPAPVMSPPFMPPAPAAGMSQGTMVAIGLGVIGLVAVVLATRKD